jgi:hypothetical protein
VEFRNRASENQCWKDFTTRVKRTGSSGYRGCLIFSVSLRRKTHMIKSVYFVNSLLSAYRDSRCIQEGTVQYPDEKHLANLRQLTFGGDNAEAYWSFDGKKLVFQSNNPAWELKCDQIFYTTLERRFKSHKAAFAQHRARKNHMSLFFTKR